MDCFITEERGEELRAQLIDSLAETACWRRTSRDKRL